MEFWINPKKGIYYTESVYHDDIDYIYVVDFDKPDIAGQFRNFLKDVGAIGKKEAMRELKREFRGLRDLLN